MMKPRIPGTGRIRSSSSQTSPNEPRAAPSRLSTSSSVRRPTSLGRSGPSPSTGPTGPTGRAVVVVGVVVVVGTGFRSVAVVSIARRPSDLGARAAAAAVDDDGGDRVDQQGDEEEHEAG